MRARTLYITLINELRMAENALESILEHLIFTIFLGEAPPDPPLCFGGLTILATGLLVY